MWRYIPFDYVHNILVVIEMSLEAEPVSYLSYCPTIINRVGFNQYIDILDFAFCIKSISF